MQKHLQIVSKELARKAGLKNYFTGIACRSGHIDERSVSEGRCLECGLAKGRRKYWKNRDELLTKRKRERKENLEESRRIRRESYHRNKNRWKETRRKYAEENREKMNVYYRERMREWRKTPEGKATGAMRVWISRVMKKQKHKRSEHILGYSHEDLIDHIERQFLKGMTWENHGKWHIDHIIPIAEFLRRGEYDPKVVNALTNLKPMWASDNLSKGASVETLL